MPDNKHEIERDNFILNFEGKDEINVETFSQSINGIVRLIKIAASIHYPDTNIKLNIVNLRKGSIEIDLSVIIDYRNSTDYTGYNRYFFRIYKDKKTPKRQ